MAAVSSTNSVPLRLSVSDGTSSRPMVASSATVRGGRSLLYAFSRAPSVGQSVQLIDAAGDILAQTPMPPEHGLPALDLDTVLNTIDGPGQRLGLLRHFSAACSAFTKWDASGWSREAQSHALERAAALAAICAVARVIDLGGGLTLWVLRNAPEAEVDAVLLEGQGDFRASPFKPLIVSSSDPEHAKERQAFLLTDIGKHALAIRRILMWGRNALSTADPRGLVVEPRANVLPLLQGLGDAVHTVVAYLAANLSPYLQSQPDLRDLLSEASTMLPDRPVRSLLSDRQIGAGVDLSLVTDGWMFASGWVVDPDDLIAKVSWIHPAGVRIPISARWHRSQRAALPERYQRFRDSDRTFGFAVSIEGAQPASWLRQQSFEVQLRTGATFELVAPPTPRTPAAGRDAVLRCFDDASYTDELSEKTIGPVIASLQRAHLAGDRIKDVIAIGDQSGHPAVSIVIPVYKALEFLRYQIVAFATDPDLRNIDLVYVLDSPEQAGDVEMRLRALHALYGVPLRLVVHRRNLGYAPAVNTGVAHSRGAILVLMNSDVVPAANGWMRTMRKRLKKDVGAVGPKLLFHDDSIQHAGMAFARDLKGRYFNRHVYKGWPRHFPLANQARATPALTGACLMLQRSVYDEVGRICEDYVVGDFEDSDFCMRIAATARTLFYEPAAELYHFERQSIAQNESYTKTSACTYNRLLHSRRWRLELERLTACPDTPADRKLENG